MTDATWAKIGRLTALLRGGLTPPPGRGRILVAIAFGVTVHTIFAAAVLAMMMAMYHGMSRSCGAPDWPYAALANALLLLQFPLVHSLLLTQHGTRLLRVWTSVTGPYLSSVFAQNN